MNKWERAAAQMSEDWHRDIARSQAFANRTRIAEGLKRLKRQWMVEDLTAICRKEKKHGR